MSEALDYLIKTRPDAMAAYFKFLKAADSHLDTRTHDLISVITKVAAGTEGGFRQYLSRALRNGATPNEVLDALLLAFPVLGLTKITWATDILLEMDIPEFHPDQLDAEPQWHRVANEADLRPGEATYCEVDGRHLFVYQDADILKVYDSRCPHQVTDIPHLALDEYNRLTCPRHNWIFDIKSGNCMENGKRGLHQFEYKIEKGVLYAYW